MATNSGNSGQEDFDLGSLLTAATSQMAMTADTVNKLQTIGGQEQNLYDAMVQSTLATDTSLVTQTAELGKLEAQKKKTEFYEAIGMGGAGAAKISNQLAERYTQSLRDSLELSSSIKQRESVGLLDNPLEYLWNQIILPDERNALNAAVTDAKVASDGLSKINEMAQSTAQTENAFAQTTSLAAAEQQAKAVRAATELRAKSLELQATQAQAHNVVAVANANSQQLQTISQVISARNQATHTALAIESAGRERARFQEWQQDKAETEAYAADMLKYVNAGARIAGRPEWESSKILATIKGKAAPGVAQEVQALAELGYVNASTGLSQLGQTPSQALAAAAQIKVPVTSQVDELRGIAGARLKAMEGTLDTKNRAVVEAEFNKQVRIASLEKQNGIDPKDATNPYLIPSTKVMAELVGVKQTKLFQEVLAVEVGAGKLDTTDPAILINKGLEAVKSGKMTLGQLSQDLVTYYSAGSAYNSVKGQFNRFGIPEQVGYKAKIKASGEALAPTDTISGALRLDNIFTGKRTATRDLTDIVQVNELLVRILAAEAAPLFSKRSDR
jgi:hypothetical protein